MKMQTFTKEEICPSGNNTGMDHLSKQVLWVTVKAYRMHQIQKMHAYIHA
jgi:hypothetical protein